MEKAEVRSVAALLLERRWIELEQFFACSAPRDAEQFQARALLEIHQAGRRLVRWERAIDDLRRACGLEPANPFYRVNLAQAQLDAGLAEDAYESASVAVRLAPGHFPALEKSALSAAATGRWQQSLDSLTAARAHLPAGAQLPEALLGLWTQLRTRWWEPCVAGTVSLSLPQAEHQPFLERAFSDRAFMRHFHRFQGSGPDAVRVFVDRAKLSPLVTRRIDWVVHRPEGSCIGLAGIVDIDWANRRGELLVGLPDSPGPTAALQATACAMRFAFDRFGLEKLVSYVYADNPLAQRNTLHLGFKQEGLLRQHIATDEGRLDLFVNGLLRAEWQSNHMLARLGRRWGSS